MTEQTNTRKTQKGIKLGQVVSDKCDKSCKVTVAYLKKVPKYGKYIRRSTNFHVHDPQNLASKGDTVEIAPCRPISKTKRFRLIRVVEKSVEQVDIATPEMISVEDGGKD